MHPTVAHVEDSAPMSAPSTQPETAVRWSVTSWNMLGSEDPDLPAIARRLAETASDVVALQEVRRSQARRLGGALGWNVTWRRKHYPYSPLVWWRAEGLAVLSPHPIGPGRRDTLSSGHPVWTYRRRIMLSTTVTRSDRDDSSRLTVVDLHLSSDTRVERVEQAQRAAAMAARRHDASTAALVVCGDLNADCEDDVVGAFAALHVVDPGGPGTVKADRPTRRLDYVLVPRHARAIEVSTPPGGTDWRQLSDHLPVTTRFELERPAH